MRVTRAILAGIAMVVLLVGVILGLTGLPASAAASHDDWPDTPNGSFVQVSGSGQVYRIAGGAPLFVSTWAPFGGRQRVIPISLQQLESFSLRPADYTFIRGAQTGFYYEILGGAPIRLHSWNDATAISGSPPYPATSVDQAAVTHAGASGVWIHLNRGFDSCGSISGAYATEQGAGPIREQGTSCVAARSVASAAFTRYGGHWFTLGAWRCTNRYVSYMSYPHWDYSCTAGTARITFSLSY
jgi:hypothetical protein